MKRDMSKILSHFNGKERTLPDVGLTLEAGEPFDNETNAATMACNDWLRMGVTRSYPKLVRIYKRRHKNGEIVPTASLNTLRHWSYVYKWNDRARLYDGREDEQSAEQAKATMGTGLAVAFRRVEKLKELASHLEEFVYDESRLWPASWKVLGFGPHAEHRKIIHFNYQLVEQYRGVLDDLAKETGGRVHREELRGQIAIADIDELRERVSQKLEQLASQSIEE